MTRLMIVDDEAIIVIQLEEILTSMGYDVVGTATTGAEAVSKAIECKPDLILMDIKLPGGMDGIEAGTLIRQTYPVPVVFMTGYSSDELTERAKTLHPYGYLPKPFHPDYFKPIIEIAIHKHRLEQELAHVNQHLEHLVQVRTAELQRANTSLRLEIEQKEQLNRRLAEKEIGLKKAAENFEESNRALKRLAEKRKQDLIDVETDVVANVREFILPYIEKLKASDLQPTQAVYVDIIETNLKEVTAPFLSRRNQRFGGVSQQDMQIYQLHRQGKSDREISEIVNCSLSKISRCREKMKPIFEN